MASSSEFAMPNINLSLEEKSIDCIKIKKIKVLHFYKTYYPESYGGVEQFIFQLCEGSNRFGIESRVLALAKSSSADSIRIKNHLVDQASVNFTIASNSFSLASINKLRVLSAQADIIHYHFPWPFMDLAHYLSGVRKPNIVTYHSDIIKQRNLLKIYRPLMHHFLDQTDRIVTTSPNYIENSTTLKRYRNKTTVIPIGLNTELYKNSSHNSQINNLNIYNLKPFFLFIGVMRYYKGLHILLQSVLNSKIKIVVAGDGPLRKEITTLAIKYGVHNNVYFLGKVTEAEKVLLLQNCYSVVCPSHLRSEAFGISLLEGAMFGKPLISCEIGTGTSYINLHLETGLVVEPNNPSALRGAMLKLLNTPKMARTMGFNATQRFNKYFRASLMSEKYAELYRDVLFKRNNYLKN